MDTMLLTSSSSSSSVNYFNNKKNKICHIFSRNRNTVLKLKRNKINAISDVSTCVSVDPVGAQVTWQIVVGSIAGVVPFVVAGIEFSKRIVAQRRCDVCKGSGIVMREKEFFRCPNCGGFLPWQSWKRFFTG